jgi:hypothetical protein
MKFAYDGVRDRELLLTYMYTLNILNNYFIAILATDAVSFAFKLSPTGEPSSSAGALAALTCSSKFSLLFQPFYNLLVYRQLFSSACYNAMHHKSCYISK